ncbi:MAG TPA: M48 family metallopeptidase [Vicinamibacterales bacterium]|nr:M48 family metallopeptidase [Vicinamibacterales bacterium]
MKVVLVAASLTACATSAAETRTAPDGQTVITAPKNKYSPKDDVQLGREAAQQVEKELPVMRDEQVNAYLNEIGRRLVARIPSEFDHPEFQYTFRGVNLREINAFALPGGPMFVNRGMIEKARNEGEVAGVMAHEISHVALRHGTAQQTKATPFAIGQIAGQIAGAIIGGTAGQVIAQGSQFGLGTYFLKYGREYEKQADLLGARIMAAAGYDPRDMANVFRTIQQEGGSGAPQWLSSHPDPGNRYSYINQEASRLRVASATRDTREFQTVRAHLRSLSPAPSAEEVARNSRAGRTTGGESRPVTGNVERPDSRYQTYDEGNLFRISVPANWRELGDANSVTFAPEGAYGAVNGQSVFTHGVQVGVARQETHDLQTATDELIQGLQQGNPQLRRQSNYARGTIGGRQGLRTTLTNVSEATGGQEVVDLYTTQLSDGSLFYIVGVAPTREYDSYRNVFGRVVSSIRFTR